MMWFRNATGFMTVMAEPCERIQKWSCQESGTLAVSKWTPERVVIFCSLESGASFSRRASSSESRALSVMVSPLPNCAAPLSMKASSE